MIGLRHVPIIKSKGAAFYLLPLLLANENAEAGFLELDRNDCGGYRIVETIYQVKVMQVHCEADLKPCLPLNICGCSSHARPLYK